MELKNLKNALKEIIENDPQSLRAEVASEALSYDDEIETFFSDLQMHGCQSGMVGKLIYYCDTHKFYDTYYDEIEALRQEFEQSFGEPLRPKGDLKNWFAWMAFEETARLISECLGL